MLRRAVLFGLLATSTARALPRTTIDITGWMHTNELDFADQEATKASSIITDDVKQQIMKKYYEPMVSSIDPSRVATGAECHWFKTRDKIFFPTGPSQNFDRKLVDQLRTKVVAMLSDDNFKIAGLTITEPSSDSKGNPFTYLIIGVVTGPIIIPPMDSPKDNPKAKPRQHSRRRPRDDDSDSEEDVDMPSMY